MGLEEVQRGLVILLTNDALREQFAADPQSAARTLNLTPEDAAHLAAMAQNEVERFARSLCAKRWNEIQKLLPLSCQAAQSAEVGLRRVFMQFAQTYTPQGGKRHAQDALQFAAWIGQKPKSSQQAKPSFHAASDSLPAEMLTGNGAWLPDLLRYEAAWLEMNLMPSRRCLLRRFEYPVPTLARALSRLGGEGLPDPASVPIQPVMIVWLRLSGRGRLRHYIVGIPPRAANPHSFSRKAAS